MTFYGGLERLLELDRAALEFGAEVARDAEELDVAQGDSSIWAEFAQCRPLLGAFSFARELMSKMLLRHERIEQRWTGFQAT